ncbi:major facilitator superfamily domain-containing protein [Aspergillus ambiguus]|uniref:putative MFS multidrug transporter n=1 Tax=Aspergillus ambiguus TaxID=176160 RepID=UPI003CCCEEB2
MSDICMSHFGTDKATLDPSLEQLGLQVASDGFHVQWAKGNRRHPRNWNRSRKLYDTFLIIFLELFTTAISTSGSTTATDALHEFDIPRELAIFIFVSLYLLGQGIGAILLPPYSESFGRKNLYVASSALYSISCAIVAAVPSLIGVIVGRFVSGFVSSIPTTVVVGSIEDMYNSRDRVWLICVWAIASNFALVLGPILSTFITEDLGWRWVFYVATMVTGVLAFLLLTIRESRPSLLLAQEVSTLRKITGIETLQAFDPDRTPDLRTFVRVALGRPVRLLFTELIVFVVSFMSGIAVALVYLFTEALPPIYEAFGFNSKQSCLPFVALGIGILAGLSTRYIDLRVIDKHRRQGHTLVPEHKLTGFSIGTPILAAALWIYAWTIPPGVTNVHWIVSVIALVLIGYSLNEIDYVLGGYLTDSYLSYAASGLAALSLVRALLSAILPLISTPMFTGIGNNLAVSVLAGLATVFCIVPPLFARFGRVIRARSAFAKYSLRMYTEHSVEEDGL